jgi:ATP-dependent DNA ligase
VFAASRLLFGTNWGYPFRLNKDESNRAEVIAKYERWFCNGAAVLCAFDLIELDGKDLRPSPIEQRKDQLGKLLQSVRRSHHGITLNQHYEGDGATI